MASTISNDLEDGLLEKSSSTFFNVISKKLVSYLVCIVNVPIPTPLDIIKLISRFVSYLIILEIDESLTPNMVPIPINLSSSIFNSSKYPIFPIPLILVSEKVLGPQAGRLNPIRKYSSVVPMPNVFNSLLSSI